MGMKILLDRSLAAGPWDVRDMARSSKYPNILSHGACMMALTFRGSKLIELINMVRYRCSGWIWKVRDGGYRLQESTVNVSPHTSYHRVHLCPGSAGLCSLLITSTKTRIKENYGVGISLS